MDIERTYSGAPWEQDIGYCQAIRAGNHIYITGAASQAATMVQVTALIDPAMMIEIEAGATLPTANET